MSTNKATGEFIHSLLRPIWPMRIAEISKGEAQQVFLFDKCSATCSFPLFSRSDSRDTWCSFVFLFVVVVAGRVFFSSKVAPPPRKLTKLPPLRMMSRSYIRKGKSIRSKRRAKEASCTMHLRKKVSFMKVLGLQFALPLRRVKSDNNNDENSLNNNNNDSDNENVNVTNTMMRVMSKDKKKGSECYECKTLFKSKKAYELHVKRKHRNPLPYSCKICSKKFLYRKVLEEHKIRHQGTKPYCCSKCNKRFECLDALTAHIRRHLGKLPYICKICKDGFDLHIDYKEHLLVHEMKSSERPPRKLLYCSHCDKVFRKPCDLERHMRVHTGERPFICAVCGNRFQQAHNLTKHMVIHTRERRFQCEICSKLFGRKDVLTRHMLTHAIEKPFSCNVCEKTFARALQLTQHIIKHQED